MTNSTVEAQSADVQHDPSERLLTKADLAAHYQVTPRTIENWMKQGRLPYRKYSGRIVRFRLSEVEEFFDRPHLVARQRC